MIHMQRKRSIRILLRPLMQAIQMLIDNHLSQTERTKRRIRKISKSKEELIIRMLSSSKMMTVKMNQKQPLPLKLMRQP